MSILHYTFIRNKLISLLSDYQSCLIIDIQSCLIIDIALPDVKVASSVSLSMVILDIPSNDVSKHIDLRLHYTSVISTICVRSPSSHPSYSTSAPLTDSTASDEENH